MLGQPLRQGQELEGRQGSADIGPQCHNFHPGDGGKAPTYPTSNHQEIQYKEGKVVGFRCEPGSPAHGRGADARSGKELEHYTRNKNNSNKIHLVTHKTSSKQHRAPRKKSISREIAYLRQPKWYQSLSLSAVQCIHWSQNIVLSGSEVISCRSPVTISQQGKETDGSEPYHREDRTECSPTVLSDQELEQGVRSYSGLKVRPRTKESVYTST
ncbi:hypothetical protein ACJJTC_016592 [Scirpophaga incertulas]